VLLNSVILSVLPGAFPAKSITHEPVFMRSRKCGKNEDAAVHAKGHPTAPECCQSLRQRRLRQIQRYSQHMPDASPASLLSLSAKQIELLPSGLPYLQGLIAAAHDDTVSLKEALSSAVYLVHPGRRVGKLDSADTARKRMSIADQKNIFLPGKTAELSELFNVDDVAVQVEIDDEDGQRRSLPVSYHTLPLYGRLPMLQPKPEVLVTVSLFQSEGRNAWRYREGVLQMVESLPHISRRMGIRLAVFHDSSVPEDFLRVVDRPGVTLVSLDELDGSNHANSMLQVQTGNSGNFHTAMARFRWHDLAALRSEGLPRLGMTDFPDVVMSYDVDSLLDSPFLDWWVRQVVQSREHIFIIEGSQSPGPNGIARAIDASTFAVAPKRMPPEFEWPRNAVKSFLQVDGKSLRNANGLQPRTSGIQSFMYGFVQSHRNGYGIDEEVLCSMIDAVIARDGSAGVRASTYRTLDMVITATMNTGEDDEICGQSICDEVSGNGTQLLPPKLTYGLWIASGVAVQQHEHQAAQGHHGHARTLHA